jgi:starch synthase (maltosyl-transferring)
VPNRTATADESKPAAARERTSSEKLPPSGRVRAIIERPTPCVDAARFPVKRVEGERVDVECDAFTDGHDLLRVVLRHRHAGGDWRETEMRPTVNDRWRGSFSVHEVGFAEYTICAWVDRFATWRDALVKKADAHQDIALELRAGAELLRDYAASADSADAAALEKHAHALENEKERPAGRVDLAASDELASLAARADPRRFVAELGFTVPIRVDRERANFSAWYEAFPRSLAETEGEHGTFKDVERHLPHVAALGFDVLYLPPIHPIGMTHRKGRNNALQAEPGDVGSPWAIGGPKADGAPGGHTDVHPDLGTLSDFESLVEAAGQREIEIALDIAFQCSPDHPWVREHPEWFNRRPDGSIQYAENPPKKYQDIYPINFESDDWEHLWIALRDVMSFWAERGVRIFRVDNPHTKAFGFWEWAIADLQRSYPDLIFLAEAFTRPKLMRRLAKLGFTQSYTYFAWRREPWELREYCEELTKTEMVDFFRPNFWPNTPDILTDQLVEGGRAALMSRLVLAATLSSNYGVYGPPYEAQDVRNREPGSEEYLDSEKYQLRRWNHSMRNPMSAFMARVNRIRREHPALRQNRTLRFHDVSSDRMLAYSKTTPDKRDAVLVVVSAETRREEWGDLHLDLEALGVGWDEPFTVCDLLTGARYQWRGARQVVGLSPEGRPAHVFHIERPHRTEADHSEFDSL